MCRVHGCRRHHDRSRGPRAALDLPRDLALSFNRREAPHPLVSEIHAVLLAHLHELYAFYGRERVSRSRAAHLLVNTKGLAGSASFRHT